MVGLLSAVGATACARADQLARTRDGVLLKEKPAAWVDSGLVWVRYDQQSRSRTIAVQGQSLVTGGSNPPLSPVLPH